MRKSGSDPLFLDALGVYNSKTPGRTHFFSKLSVSTIVKCLFVHTILKIYNGMTLFSCVFIGRTWSDPVGPGRTWSDLVGPGLTYIASPTISKLSCRYFFLTEVTSVLAAPIPIWRILTPGMILYI